jgi:uncharacterized protein (DUF1800 family)
MLTPLDPNQWSREKAAHLLNRAGFGGTPEEIDALRVLGLKVAVDKLLDARDDDARFPKPGWAVPRDIFALRREARALPESERKERMKEMIRGLREHGMELVSWWLDRMRTTEAPLREKMTLFWHGHFATSMQKVKEPYLMWLQNETLRSNALGNFGTMTKAISRDPAMLIWLDTRESQREHPNENFARELMELFTLGIGNYTEQDVQEAARAFTGYRINPVDESFRFSAIQHDDGEKKLFGRAGKLQGDEVIDQILARPVCATFIVRKIWEFFAYEDPAPGFIDALAVNFRAQKYELRPLLREIFRSKEFYSLAAVRTQIKSPVQWMVQTAKVLNADLPKGFVAVNALRQLGQVPFAPPSVKGWDGGKSWITTSTLLFRYNLANFAVGNGPLNVQRMRGVGTGKNHRPSFDVQNRTPLDLEKIAPATLRGDPTTLAHHVIERIFQHSLTPHETDNFVRFLTDRPDKIDDQTIRDLLHLMMSTPQFQLT